MFCKQCGAKIANDNAKFCPSCGAATKTGTPKEQPVVVNVTNQNTNVNSFGIPQRSKWVTFFLCLFLGMFGVHRFYTGKIGTGLIWLFTFGVGGIGWILDLIFILLGSYRDKSGFPLK